MHELLLTACTSSPLASYLKAIGILRLVHEQVDREVRGFWSRGTFTLVTSMASDDLREFLLKNYEPTPIISPWNGRAGFLEGENSNESTRKGAVIVRRVEKSKGRRFARYRAVLQSVRKVSVIEQLDRVRAEVKRLSKCGSNADPEGERLKRLKREEKLLKNQLLVSLRNELDDCYLSWLDACMAVVGGEQMAAPLLGSGGNEGSMDFSINHLELLTALIDEDDDTATALARNGLDNALFGTIQLAELAANPGFMNPLGVGGPNMGNGFSEFTGENPWNAVLMLEGALLFGAAATKRLGSAGSARLSFPFVVEPVCAGQGSIAARESSRPEFWAPLWSGPASAMEVRTLLTEGRNTIGRRQARDGLDMARATATLGVSRGLSGFQRFGLFERRGQGYYVATPLGYFPTKSRPVADWVGEFERSEWIERFRSYARAKTTPDRFVVLRRRFEDQLLVIAGRAPTPGEAQLVIALLGDIHTEIATSRAAQQIVPPIPELPERWVAAADDGTHAFRIASALAGLREERGHAMPIRAQIFPIHHASHTWIDDARRRLINRNDPSIRVHCHTRWRGEISPILVSMLKKRILIAEKLEQMDKPFRSTAGVTLSSVSEFMRGRAMDKSIAALVPGLSLCRVPPYAEYETDGVVPAAFALLKTCLIPDTSWRRLGLLREGKRMPIPAGLTQQLASGNIGNRAVRAAWRRLVSSGLSPSVAQDALPDLGEIDPSRAAAALLIPLNLGSIRAMSRNVLAPGKEVSAIGASAPPTTQDGETV